MENVMDELPPPFAVVESVATDGFATVSVTMTADGGAVPRATVPLFVRP